jgi:hypothetical protein
MIFYYQEEGVPYVQKLVEQYFTRFFKPFPPLKEIINPHSRLKPVYVQQSPYYMDHQVGGFRFFG